MNALTFHISRDEMQISNELRYCRKHLNGALRRLLQESDDLVGYIDAGVDALNEWINQDWSSFPKKAARLAQLDRVLFPALVSDIIVATMYCREPEELVNVVGQLAVILGYEERRDSLTTVAELVAIVADSDAYDVFKADKYSPIEVVSRIPLPEELLEFASRSQHIMPMLVCPKPITRNFESPYLTFNESQILGRFTDHTGDICLDVLNTQNQIALEMDIEFLHGVDEEPTKPLDTMKKQEAWQKFMADSQATYALMAQQGNKLWLTHRVDKRGRIYANGYHITTQGSPYKKAMLEFANKEPLEGLPE